MRFLIPCMLLVAMIFGCGKTSIQKVDNASLGKESIVVDHRCTEIEKIPKYWIEKAKKNFGISYGHTSHGSQIISGMEALQNKDRFFSFSEYSGHRYLTVFDREPEGDLGNPDRTTWYARTKDLLDHGWGDTNVVLWSWCGQVSNASKKDINTVTIQRKN